MSHPVGSRFLLGDSLQPASKAKYISAVSNFITWCIENQHSVQTFAALDELVADYIHCLYEIGDGKGKGEASCLVYGIIKFLPRAKFQLLTAQASLVGWLKKCPSRSYPPITWPVAGAVAIHLVRSGLVRCGIAVLLAFDCFLRCGELVALRKKDVAENGDHRLGSEYAGMALRLKKTKTGANQWVEINNEEVKFLVRFLVHSTDKPSDRLFPLTSSQFRAAFKQAVQTLQLPNYVPHSLRHGGATRWHLLGHSIEDVMLRGRWSSTKSARRYVQSGRAMLLSLNILAAVAASGEVVVDNLLASFSYALSQLH